MASSSIVPSVTMGDKVTGRERLCKIHPLHSWRVSVTEINGHLPNGDEDPDVESLDDRHDQHLGI